MRQSMTGFASLQGGGQGLSWTWELRGVNGKGLDLRLRLPDWIDGLDDASRLALLEQLRGLSYLLHDVVRGVRPEGRELVLRVSYYARRLRARR